MLSAEQRKELVQFVFEEADSKKAANNLYYPSSHNSNFTAGQVNQPLTEIQEGDLYMCLEQRAVCVCNQAIDLTATEFDILALLVMNPKRVFTYEMLIELVWHEDYTCYSRKAVNNHVSNLRKKLRIGLHTHKYIKNIVGVGYKFDTL